VAAGLRVLELAAGVTIVGGEGVQLDDWGYHQLDLPGARVQGAEGARLVSVHCPQGANVDGSLTMEKFSSTGGLFYVAPGASLVMEDCRVFCSGGSGVWCEGKVEAIRCTFEHNGSHGVDVGRGEVKLVDCVVRNNNGGGSASTCTTTAQWSPWWAARSAATSGAACSLTVAPR